MKTAYDMRSSDWSSDVCSSDLEGLHLGHELVHADPLGKRGVDVHRLAGDAAALFLILDEMEGPHIVQPVGELHQQHPDIARHGEQELPEILRRALALALRLDLRQLGDAVDQPRDILAEELVDLLRDRKSTRLNSSH